MISLGLIITGLANGFLYALMALVFTLLFRTVSTANLAEGEQAALLAFLGLTFYNMGVPYGGVILLVMFFAVCMAVSMYFGVLKWLPSEGILMALVVTLGFNIFLNGISQYFWAEGEPYNFPTPISTSNNILGISGITSQHVLIFFTTMVILGGIYILLEYTKVGLQIRAMADNREAAKLMGIDENFVRLMCWIIGTVIVGFAGVLFSPLLFLDTAVMTSVMYKALSAAVLGGLMSLPGAVVAGLLLGLIENLVVPFAPNARDAVALLIVIAILFIKPAGLFGNIVVKKV